MRTPRMLKQPNLFPIMASYAALSLALCSQILAVAGQRIVQGRLPGVGEDFLALSIGGWLIAHGQGGQLYELPAQAQAQATIVAAAGGATSGYGLALFVYPPFVALPFAALAGLPLLTAYLAWISANLAILACAIWLMVRTVRPPAPGYTALLALAALSFLPVWTVMLRGQVSLLMLCLLLGCYLALRADREGLAGLCLALALAKPQLVVVPVLVLLGQRRWRALLGCALGGTALALFSVAAAGPLECLDYLRLLTQVGRETTAGSLVHPVYMFNWRGTAIRMVNLAFGESYPAAQSLALCLYAALSLASLAWLLKAWRGGWAANRQRLAGLWALTVVVGLLVSPHLHEYDLCLWLLVGALAIASARDLDGQISLRWQGTLALMHALPALTLGLGLALRAQAGVAGSCLAAAALWFSLARRAADRRQVHKQDEMAIYRLPRVG